MFIISIIVVAISSGVFPLEVKRFVYSDMNEVPDYPAVWNDIEVTLTELLVPGMVMTVVQDQGDYYKVWSKTFGFASMREPRVSVSFGGSKFGIGSLSKAFTATLLGILLTEYSQNYPDGWDTKLIDIMGDSFSIPPSMKDLVTLRDIVSHRTGLYTYTPFLVMGLDNRHPGEYCRRMRLLDGSGFRGNFLYNNIMYVLAGCAAEAIGNDTFANLLKKKVFEPIGMENTTLLGEPEVRNFADVPLMYFKNHLNQLLVQMDQSYLSIVENLSAAGAILSTGAAMAKWIMFHLNQGKTLSGQQLVNRTLWTEMHSTQIPTKWSSVATNISGYGMGWMVGTYRNTQVSEHGGRIAGFDSKVTLAMEKGFGIFTSANGPAYESYYVQDIIHHLIYDIFNNETVWLNRTLLASYPSIIPINDTLPDIPTKRGTRYPTHYTGTYGNALFGNFTIFTSPSPDLRQGGSEILQFRYGLHGTGWLAPKTATHLEAIYEGALEHVHLTIRGQPYKFNLTFSDMNSHGRYDTMDVIDDSKISTTFRRDYKWNPFMTSQGCNQRPNTLIASVLVSVNFIATITRTINP